MSSLVEVKIDEGIREDLARSFSSAGIELHPKQTEACTSVHQPGEDLSPLRRGCKVSSPVNVLKLFRFYCEHHAAPPRLHLLLIFTPRKINRHHKEQIVDRNIWPKRCTNGEKGR